MIIKFFKMHGLGNDYIFVNLIGKKIFFNPSKFSIFASNRNFGIGSDGLVLIESSKIADAKMRIFNSDGSEAEMCGNAIRCVAKYLYESGIVGENRFKIETLSGLKNIEIVKSDKKIISINVDMGKYDFSPKSIPCLINKKLINFPINVDENLIKISALSVGNPHAVVFVENFNFNISELGYKISNLSIFPKQINVEFVKVVDRNHLRIKVYERGSGVTKACGTGACASSVVSCLLNKCDFNNDIVVELDGGILKINVNSNKKILMNGPASYVFEGKITYSNNKNFYINENKLE